MAKRTDIQLNQLTVSNVQLHLESRSFSSFKPVSCIQESIRIGGEVSKSTNKAVKG